MDARTYLIQLLLSSVNEYLTVEKFAEHHGLTTDQAARLLQLAREVHELPHPDY